MRGHNVEMQHLHTIVGGGGRNEEREIENTCSVELRVFFDEIWWVVAGG
jgi:hypothetical protein